MLLCLFGKKQREDIHSFPILQDHMKAKDFAAEQSTFKRMSMYLIIQVFSVIT